MRRGITAMCTSLLTVMFVLLAGCAGDRGAPTGGPDGGGAGSDSAGGSGAAAAFGDLETPCGAGDAKGATDQGVTDTSIRIAYGDDRGFPGSPGLEQDAGDAVKAMIEWCNQQGGINGRKIIGDYNDAAITQTNQVVQQACKTDFMLVGSAFAGDETAEATRVDCNLVSVPTYAVGPSVANAPIYYAAVPNPVDLQPVSGFAQMLKLHPEVKDGFAFVNSDLPAVTATNTKLAPVVSQLGYTILDCGVSISFRGEPSYVPFAEKLKACGAKVVYIPLNPSPVIFNFISAMNQVGADPYYIMQASGYSDVFSKWNTAGLGDKVHVQMAFPLMENADQEPAVKAYLDALEKVEGKPGLLGMQATSSFLLWASAAKDCGSDLTRQCIVDKLSQVHTWTAGGLNGETDPGANKPPKCGLLAKLDGATWTQVYPEKVGELECDDSYVAQVPQSAWGGVTLNENRINPRFLTPNTITPKV